MSTYQQDCDLLGISKTSDINAIKKAYKKKALQKHPDRGGSEEEFQNLKNAYDRLIKHKENPFSTQSFNNIPTTSTTMNDLFNEDIFQFAFNKGFPPGVFTNNTAHTSTFRPSSRRVKIKTQIINGERKTTVEEFFG